MAHATADRVLKYLLLYSKPCSNTLTTTRCPLYFFSNIEPGSGIRISRSFWSLLLYFSARCLFLEINWASGLICVATSRNLANSVGPDMGLEDCRLFPVGLAVIATCAFLYPFPTCSSCVCFRPFCWNRKKSDFTAHERSASPSQSRREKIRSPYWGNFSANKTQR